MPRVFISSTIRDLADLRSAMKYWLEQLGFEVQASDFADFEHAPDAEAIEACYEVVRTSDLYVLVIGADRGSMIDRDGEAISVTQGEYRAAYLSFQQTGKPKIVSFVRRSMTPEVPDFTTKFIDEVRRTGEVDRRANWTTPFSGFRDIVDGLRSSIPAVRDPLPTQALLAALENELLTNLRTFALKMRGEPGWLHSSMRSARIEIRLRKEDLDTSYTLTRVQLQWMSLFASVGSPPTAALITLVLDQAVGSGQLLEFDRALSAYRPGTLLRVLHQLHQELALFARRRQSFNETTRDVWQWAWARRDEAQPLEIPVHAILPLLALYDTQRNVVALMIGLISFLRGGRATPEPAHLQTQTPITGLQQEIDEETITIDELRMAIDGNEPWVVSANANTPPEQEAALWELVGRVREALGEELARKIGRGEVLSAEDLTEDARQNLQRIFHGQDASGS